MWSRQCHCPRGGLAHGNPRRRRTGVLAPGAREREELVGHDVVFDIGVADVGVEGEGRVLYVVGLVQGICLEQAHHAEHLGIAVQG